MKSNVFTVVVAMSLFACSTAQLNQAAAIAIPIAEAAATAAGAYFGVSPTSVLAVTQAANALWGAAKQAQAGQPIANGTTIKPVGVAIDKAVATQAALNPTMSATPNNVAAVLNVAAVVATNSATK